MLEIPSEYERPWARQPGILNRACHPSVKQAMEIRSPLPTLVIFTRFVQELLFKFGRTLRDHSVHRGGNEIPWLFFGLLH